MIDMSRLDVPAVLEHYILANTPKYLYRHLRSEPSVEELAKSCTPSELVEAVRECDANPDRNETDVAIAYAMLVALSFQNYMDVKAAVADWQPQVLEWAKQIISIICHSAISTTVVHLNGQLGRIGPPQESNKTPFTMVTLQ